MNEKQKFILSCVVLVAAIVGLGVLHFMKLKERAEFQAQIDRYTKQARQAQEKIRQIPELRDQREKLASFIDEYMKILPKEEHVQHDAFVNIIGDYRKDVGNIVIRSAEYVEIKEKKEKDKRGRKAKEPEKQKDFVRHRYLFKLEATVPNLIAFIAKIENHARFLKVDSIDIKPLGARGDFKGSSSEKEELELLALAANPTKSIELTISTYTYFKGSENKKS